MLKRTPVPNLLTKGILQHNVRTLTKEVTCLKRNIISGISLICAILTLLSLIIGTVFFIMGYWVTENVEFLSEAVTWFLLNLAPFVGFFAFFYIFMKTPSNK